MNGRTLFQTTTLLIALIGVFAAPVQPQSSGVPADRPKFDVASIKRNNSAGVGRVNLTQPGGHLTASNVSVKFLMIQAYHLERIHFGSNPPGVGWIDSEHFDIEAEAEGSPTVEQKRLMIQSLLADRFKLKMHPEIRQLRQYALVLSKVGKVGPQLHRHTDDTKCLDVPAGEPSPGIIPDAAILPLCGRLRVLKNDIIGQNVTIEKLAQTLSVLLSRDVVDRTGLEGTFDLTLHFQIVPLDSDADVFDPSEPPPISTALGQQLGLNLKSQRGPVEVVVIDHVEEPSAN